MKGQEHNDIPGLPPFPWLIPNAHCVNCGGCLAWVSGVGRLVVRHENGDIRCPWETVELHPADKEAANRVYQEMDETLVLLRMEQDKKHKKGVA